MPKIAQNVTCVNGPLTMFIGPASFQERYLGGAKKRKKVRRLADRKFVFDWDTVKILAVFFIIIIFFYHTTLVWAKISMLRGIYN